MNKTKLFLGSGLATIALLGWGCQKDSTPVITEQNNAPAAAVTSGTELSAPTQTATPTSAAAQAPTTIKPAPATKPTTTAKKPINTIVPNSTKQVNIGSTGFSPQVLAVKAGDTVVWVNKDTRPHTTVSDGALLWDSGNLVSGKSYSHIFKSVGTYAYHDGNTNAKGTIVVY